MKSDETIFTLDEIRARHLERDKIIISAGEVANTLYHQDCKALLAIIDKNPRKYSLDEIDLMRNSIAVLGASGLHIPNHQEIEEKLRTYMFAGTDPEEIAERARLYEEAG